MNRKEFIRRTSIIGMTSFAGTSLLSAASRTEESLITIIDTHQHLWDIKRFDNGWSIPPLKRNFDSEDYKSAIEGLNIVKSVYMEVAVPADKRREEALYAIEICKDKTNPTVAAVIAADANTIDFNSYLSEFKDSLYIKGIRYFFKSEKEITSRQVVDNIQSLGRMNMSFDFSIPSEWLLRMAELTRFCPETTFVVNHCGNVDPRAFFKAEDLMSEKPDHDPDKWIGDMKVLASSRNVVCKISDVATRALNHHLTAINLAAPVNHCLNIFGPDRVMFATDWPVCLKKIDVRNWVNILKEIVRNRPYAERIKLFHDNAIKFYNI